jgi:hypothetical protein
MDDNRVRVATTKIINLAQLDAELGGHGLSGSDTEVVAVEGSPVTEAQLAAAVKAHRAVWPPTREEVITAAIQGAKSLDELKSTLVAILAPVAPADAQPIVVGRESLNIPANIDNDVTLNTVTP